MSSYLKMLNGQEYKIGRMYPPTECFRCGICCMRFQPRLTPEEVQTLAKELGLTVSNFLSRYVQTSKVGYLLRQREGGCIFLTREEGEVRAGCSIYPFRPEACRNWVPSLFRRECQEGLTELKSDNKIMLVDELYLLPEARDRFYSSLE